MSANNLQQILKRPRVTEKSATLSAGEDRPIYTFEVGARTNKAQVRSAIKTLYKVTPVQVNIINVPSKQIVSRGRVGTKSGFKKAMVYLKKGDKIEVV